MLRLFADLGFRWKIAIPILLLAILMVLMGALGMQGISQVADSSTRLTHRHLPAISLLLNADRDLYQAFIAERSLLDESAIGYADELRNSLRRTSSRPMSACTSMPGCRLATRRLLWWPGSTRAFYAGRPHRAE